MISTWVERERGGSKGKKRERNDECVDRENDEWGGSGKRREDGDDG